MSAESLKTNLAAMEERLAIIEKKLFDSGPSQKTVASKSKAKPKLPVEPLSGAWLGVVAAVCFILAAAFIIKLSIVSGWLTHEKQLGLATLLGLALIAAGILIFSKDKIYASFLPAAGCAILYLTCFAAYQYYLLIAFKTLIVLSSIISAISIWFYVRFKHDVYAIIAAIGAYSAPLVAPIGGNAIFSLYYFILCSLTFATISVWVQSRILIVISSYLSILITGYIGLNLEQNGLIAIILALNFIIFSVGAYFHTHLTQQGMTEIEAWSFFPVLLIWYALEYYFITLIEPAYAPWVALATAVFLIALYYFAENRSSEKQLNSLAVLLTFVTLISFHSIYIELMPALVKPWLFVMIVVGCSLVHPKVLLSKSGMSLIVPFIALSLILGIEYLDMLSHLLGRFNLPWTIVAWASFAGIWFAYMRHSTELRKNYEYGFSLLATAHLLCVLALYQLTNQYGSLAVSSSWLLYALIVLGLSIARSDVLMTKSVLIVLALAAGKALLYDAASTPTIIRILSLILTGSVLYASGFMIRKMTSCKS